MAGRSSRPTIVKRPTSAEPCIWSVKRRSNSESEARSTVDPTRSLATSQPAPNITTISRTTKNGATSCLTRAMGSLQAWLVVHVAFGAGRGRRKAGAEPVVSPMCAFLVREHSLYLSIDQSCASTDHVHFYLETCAA